MASVGIIAEFNPLHTGHKYLIDEAKKLGTVTAVISGDFVQRGDLSIVDKRIRAKAALMCGVDLCLELPVAYSMSTAQSFALGGVSALKAAGCDTLMFGSECGDADLLITTAKALKTEQFKEKLQKYLESGITFAAAREKAALDLGVEGGILGGANNNLAIEYILAADSICADFKFVTVKRMGAEHDSLRSDQAFVSASLLREKLKSGDTEFIKKYIPENILPLFTKENIADIKKLEAAILSVLRTRSLEELKALPDISEGIENKLFSAIGVATSLDGLYNEIKVKRYTMARIRRLVLSAFLGLDNSFFMRPPPYIRVLGMNNNGIGVLKSAPKGDIPLITRVSEIESLSDSAKKLFGAECRATDLCSLALDSPKPKNLEYTEKIIKTE